MTKGRKRKYNDLGIVRATAGFAGDVGSYPIRVQIPRVPPSFLIWALLIIQLLRKIAVGITIHRKYYSCESDQKSKGNKLKRKKTVVERNGKVKKEDNRNYEKNQIRKK